MEEVKIENGKVKRRFTPEWDKSGLINYKKLPDIIEGWLKQREIMVEYIESLHNVVDKMLGEIKELFSETPVAKPEHLINRDVVKAEGGFPLGSLGYEIEKRLHSYSEKVRGSTDKRHLQEERFKQVVIELVGLIKKRQNNKVNDAEVKAGIAKEIEDSVVIEDIDKMNAEGNIVRFMCSTVELTEAIYKFLQSKVL